MDIVIGFIFAIVMIIVSTIIIIINCKKINENYLNEENVDLSYEADKLNKDIENKMNSLDNILSINNINKFDYNEYYGSQINQLVYANYTSLPKPNLYLIKKQYGCLKENELLERIFKGRKIVRLKQEERCNQILEEKLIAFNNDEQLRIKEYIKSHKKLEENINDILKRKEEFINFDEIEVCNVISEFIEENIKDTIYESSFSIKYNTIKHMCVINYKYSNMSIIPEYKFYNNNLNIGLEGVEIKEKERKKMYEEYIYKVTLKLIKIIFSFDNDYIKKVVFNGLVFALNEAKGSYEDFIILSISTSEEEFSTINLSNVTPRICLEALNFRFVKNLEHIKNIVPFDTTDSNTKSEKWAEEDNFDMNGYEFEEFCKELLIADDFTNVEVTSYSGDFGADIIAYKNDIKYAIQCKKYSQTVGVKAIQEVMGSKSIYSCHVAAVLTNSTFTNQARKLASKNNVILWDREKLKELVNQYKKKTNV